MAPALEENIGFCDTHQWDADTPNQTRYKGECLCLFSLIKLFKTETNNIVIKIDMKVSTQNE